MTTTAHAAALARHEKIGRIFEKAHKRAARLDALRLPESRNASRLACALVNAYRVACDDLRRTRPVPAELIEARAACDAARASEAAARATYRANPTPANLETYKAAKRTTDAAAAVAMDAAHRAAL